MTTKPQIAKTVFKGNVLSLYFDNIAAGWEQWVLLASDRHHDNPHCDRRLEKEHLDTALERRAVILDFGDLFCAMQGKYDPRSSMDDVRPEDVGEDYLDRIVKHAARDYGAYAQNFLLIGKGNHETNIRKRHGTDLTSNLVHRLNSDHGGNCNIGGIGGWVRFMFQVHGTRRHSVRLKYHHGSGGAAPVTRGTIKTNRMAVYLPDADIVVTGHTHNAYYLPRARERLTHGGKITRDLVHFVQTPGYKEEYGDGSSGFHNEGQRDPRPIGCFWLRFFFSVGRVEMEITQALR